MPASKIETAFGKRPPCSSTNSSARARAVLSRLTLKIAFRSSATSPISLAGTWESTLRSKCTTHLCHSTPGGLLDLALCHIQSPFALVLVAALPAQVLPGAAFCEDLAERYPQAGVILMVRDPDRWYESAR